MAVKLQHTGQQPRLFFFHFKCSFLHLFVLFALFCTFLKLKSGNKGYAVKNEFMCLYSKFEAVHLFSCSLVRIFLSLFIFTLCFCFWNYSFQISASIYGLHSATEFGADYMCVSSFYATKLFMFLELLTYLGGWSGE
jgi:hypothetical protein